MKYSIKDTEEYRDWFAQQTHKSQRQIFERLEKIKNHGHFGHINDDLGDDLIELKFNDGRRIYYVIIPVSNVILLLGGNKNGQTKDINKAKAIFRKLIKS